MNKHVTSLKIDALANALGVSVPLTRKWLWKLDMKPDHVSPSPIQTTKGRRVAYAAWYRNSQLEKLRAAMKAKERT